MEFVQKYTIKHRQHYKARSQLNDESNVLGRKKRNIYFDRVRSNTPRITLAMKLIIGSLLSHEISVHT